MWQLVFGCTAALLVLVLARRSCAETTTPDYQGASPTKPTASATVASPKKTAALPGKRKRSISFQWGVERLFGFAGYQHTTRASTNFGDFKTRHAGYQFFIFGANPSRGDGADGINIAAYPRVYFDVRTKSGFQFGMAGSAAVSAGKRKLETEGTEQDPYIYPTRFTFVLQPRVGQLFRLSPHFGVACTVGPQLGYLRYSGDGAFEQQLLWQVTLATSFYWFPNPAVQLGLSPTADIGVAGSLRQSLQVAGIPASPVQGKVIQHSYGLSFSGGWVF